MINFSISITFSFIIFDPSLHPLLSRSTDPLEIKQHQTHVIHQKGMRLNHDFYVDVENNVVQKIHASGHQYNIFI